MEIEKTFFQFFLLQAKPMLNFQTDYDLNTGEQVLTCFLLPQVEFSTDKHGKTIIRHLKTNQKSLFYFNKTWSIFEKWKVFIFAYFLSLPSVVHMLTLRSCTFCIAIFQKCVQNMVEGYFYQGLTSVWSTWTPVKIYSNQVLRDLKL